MTCPHPLTKAEAEEVWCIVCLNIVVSLKDDSTTNA